MPVDPISTTLLLKTLVAGASLGVTVSVLISRLNKSKGKNPILELSREERMKLLDILYQTPEGRVYVKEHLDTFFGSNVSLGDLVMTTTLVLKELS